MKYTRTNPTETETELKISLSPEEIKTIRALSVTKLAKNVKVPGFRAGKVPAKIAEKNLDPNLLESQILEDAVNKSVIDVIEKENIQALDRPQVEVDKYDGKTVLDFTAKIQILPTIKLGDYKKLKAVKPKIKVDQSEINEVIDRIRIGMAEKKEVTRAAQDGDEVTMDFEGLDAKNQPVEGASGKDYILKLGSKTFIPGFEEGIVGKKAGDKFELKLTFPKSYHAKKLAGAKITFKIELKKVTEVILPKIDDDLAKKAGPFKTADEMIADTKRELTTHKERQAENTLKDDLLEQLVKVSHIPLPAVLVEDQMDSIERDSVQNLMYRGMTLEQYLESQNLTKDEWREKELKEAAERRVQVGLVLAELSKVENIVLTKDELDAALEQRKAEAPHIAAQLDTPEARRDLANRTLTEKTVQRLIDLNN